ncbi:uncharacterized protein I206_100052 [Kwoniella pini CBS 10737]|uniref:Uncharacterized protein n=1 Tax=Kwoniella pini CBS 10737 TaxID=1296096 RepID=A0A1B9HSE9_9TREE|nr:uncharacterized protein I206_07867 [Kwoniella pini CBS 10737]OCF46196.1 hypothetical protein I206_07867 [Kwoniella pini CBS 10737]
MSFSAPSNYLDESSTQEQYDTTPLHTCTTYDQAPFPIRSNHVTSSPNTDGQSYNSIPTTCSSSSDSYSRPPDNQRPVDLPHNDGSRPLIPPYGPHLPQRPCIPPHGPCVGPIPPYTTTANNNILIGNDRLNNSNDNLTRSHSAQQGLPIMNFQNSPPEYNLNSPPEYKLLPSPSENTLLLYSPPNFTISTYPNNNIELPLYTCYNCEESFSHNNQCNQNKEKLDWLIVFLIILNFFVWGAVAYGYYCEFNGTGISINWRNVLTNCKGNQGISKWGRVCLGEECEWALVDC